MADGRILASPDGGDRGDHGRAGELRRDAGALRGAAQGTGEAQEEAQSTDPPARDRIALHLGCGKKIVPGFINIDMPGNYMGIKPDMELDISKPLPFEDEYADEVHSYHVIEHFYRWDLVTILKDWHRVLKPGGVMVTECPCLDKVRRLLVSSKSTDMQLAMLGLYGAQNFLTP